MRRAERLFRLVQALRARGVNRAADLAAGLEVSTRTVYRDIAHLQASGLPIEGQAGVGYLLRPGFDLPPLTFSQEQLEALAVALSLVESLDDADLALAAREVRDKLQAGLPAPEEGRLRAAPFLSMRRPTGAPAAARALRRAIRERRVVRFGYTDGSGRASLRDLRPLAIISFEAGWLVAGWCELRQDFRTFRLDRMRGPDLSETRFADEPGRDLAAWRAAEACVRLPRAEAAVSLPASAPSSRPCSG
jgi:predicted DNA-binding transcriptional regulator YafY